MGDLVVRHQGHEIDAVEAPHAPQAFEARLSSKTVFGTYDDVGYELARDESLTNFFQQRFLVRGIQPVFRLGTSGWQERESHPQWQMKFRLSVLGWRRRTHRIEKLHQTG